MGTEQLIEFLEADVLHLENIGNQVLIIILEPIIYISVG
jgi:hypothetical protein